MLPINYKSLKRKTQHKFRYSSDTALLGARLAGLAGLAGLVTVVSKHRLFQLDIETLLGQSGTGTS